MADKEKLLAEAERRGFRLPAERIDEIAEAVRDLEGFGRRVRRRLQPGDDAP